jgi:hypothetical protein
MVMDVADVLDTAFISGSSAGTTSLTGILNYAGVTVAGSVIGTATVDHLYDALA